MNILKICFIFNYHNLVWKACIGTIIGGIIAGRAIGGAIGLTGAIVILLIDGNVIVCLLVTTTGLTALKIGGGTDYIWGG